MTEIVSCIVSISTFWRRFVYGLPNARCQGFGKLFRREVFKMLKAEGKIGDGLIEKLMNWRHSGFNVYCGAAIWPHDEDGLENLARYIIRASFSQERMMYVPVHESSDGTAKVIYESKACPRHRSGNGKTKETFDALDWLALLTTHIPNRGEQMVRYYGYPVQSNETHRQFPFLNLLSRVNIVNMKCPFSA